MFLFLCLHCAPALTTADFIVVQMKYGMQIVFCKRLKIDVNELVPIVLEIKLEDTKRGGFHVILRCSSDDSSA